MKTYSISLLHGSYFCMEWETVSIDKVYNKSDVRVRLYVTNNKTDSGNGNASCYINGSAHVAFTMDIEGIEYSGSPDCTLNEDTRERTVYENTFTIQHKSDGTKTVRMCATIQGVEIVRSDRETIEEELSICRYEKLENIPQASEFKSIGRDVIVNGTNTLDIIIAPLNDECRHDLIISFGEYSETICNVKESVSMIIPVEWLSHIPSAESGTGLITLRTFDEHGDKIGTVQTYWNAYVPDDASPDFDKLQIDQIVQSFGLSFGWVQYASKAMLEIINPHSDWGAEIVSYYISGCGYKGTEQTLETGTINYSGSRTFKAYVTDSRGKKSNVKTVTINVSAYNPPRFLSVLSQRAENDGTVKNDGSYLRSTVSYEYDTFDGLNSVKEYVYIKKSTDSEYTQLSTAFKNGIPVVSSAQFDMNTSYDIRYKLVDKFSVSNYDDILSVSRITMEFLKGGKGISFGKEAEVENAVDCGYKLYARNGIMPLSAANDDIKASEEGLRAYTLFAVKLSIADEYILCYRGLDSDVIAGSYSKYDKTPNDQFYNPATHTSVHLDISEDGLSFSGYIRQLRTSLYYVDNTHTINVPASNGTSKTITIKDGYMSATGNTQNYDIDVIEKIYAIL